MTARSEYYVIWRKPGSGMFSIVSGVLGHLRIAEVLGLEAVIDMQEHPGTYSEMESVLGTRNMWEYYFEPIGDLQRLKATHKELVLDCGGDYPFSAIPFPFADIPWVLDTWDRYVKLRPETKAVLSQASDEIHPGREVLAVHFRGKEMRNALHHPMPPSEDQVFRRVDRQLEIGEFNRIFLVTEGAEYVDLFLKRYGKLVTALPVARSGRANIYGEYPRPLHKYRLGLEILVETHLMAECGGMICGYSNVSQMAEVLSRGKFHTVDRIWNGKLRGGYLASRFLWNYRSRVPRFAGGFGE